MSTKVRKQDEKTAKQDVKRDEWGNPIQFLLACLGYAVGLGNVWRFPYLCGRNGGAAFLIPYFIMLIIAGLPTFYMELSIGQYAGLSPAVLYGRMMPIMSGLGTGMILVQVYTATYYNILMAWSLFYLGNSFKSPLPWDGCDNYWNTKYCYDDKVEKECNGSQIYFWGKCYNCSECQPSTIVETDKLGKVTVGNISLWLDSSTRQASSAEFLDKRMLRRSDRIEDFGTPQWDLVLCLLAAWTLIFLCLCGGTATSGKVVYFTATFPYLILLALVIRGCTLDNAIEGIKFFIYPNVTLLKDGKVWADAAQQIFFSLSLGGGGLTTLASYNNFNDNIFFHSYFVVAANSMTSIFASFAIFPVIGHMSAILKKPVAEIAKGGTTLAFNVLPNAIARFPLAPLWSVLFNFMLVLLAVDSQIVLTEVPITSILDNWPHLRRGWRKPLTVGAVCLAMFLVGLLLTCPGGAYVVTIMDNYAGGYPLICLCMTEMVAIMYMYGFKNLINDIRLMLGKPPNRIFKLMRYPVNWYFISAWVLVTPVALFGVMLFMFYDAKGDWHGDYRLPTAASAVGWFITMSTVLPIPILAVYKTIEFRRSGRAFTALLRPSPLWRPKNWLDGPQIPTPDYDNGSSKSGDDVARSLSTGYRPAAHELQPKPSYYSNAGYDENETEVSQRNTASERF